RNAHKSLFLSASDRDKLTGRLAFGSFYPRSGPTGDPPVAATISSVLSRAIRGRRRAPVRDAPNDLSVVALRFRPIIIQLCEPSPANPDRLAVLDGKCPGIVGSAHCLD